VQHKHPTARFSDWTTVSTHRCEAAAKKEMAHRIENAKIFSPSILKPENLYRVTPEVQI
jgi:hypothetical protein